MRTNKNKHEIDKIKKWEEKIEKNETNAYMIFSNMER